ncbi:MAG TPA: hypothetical protein VFP59_15280 [Candidatus Angelobacter sp.]|nr:hypothetical protein [Candidatus Angelobacter sp.]
MDADKWWQKVNKSESAAPEADVVTEETIRHLNRVEQVIEQTKGVLARHGFPDDLRTVMVIGFITQMIEHHEAMLLLVRNEKVGSAFALARSVFESMYRGLWINACATNEQIAAFEQDDELPVNMTQMARAIDELHQAQGFFTDLKNRGWAGLCSYTHTGLLQLGRRFTDDNVGPSYRDGEIFEVTTTVTTCILLLVGRFLIVQNHGDDSREVEALNRTYGPVAQRNAARSAQG